MLLRAAARFRRGTVAESDVFHEPMNPSAFRLAPSARAPASHGPRAHRFPSRWGIVLAVLLPLGCAAPPQQPVAEAPAGVRIEAAFSPEAGAEALVLKFIGSARQSLRLAGYVFNSPSVVSALIDARKRGVDVQVLLDEKGNRGRSNAAAIRQLAGAGIPVRTIERYAIHHDKYIVADGRHLQTGSFNYTQGAARANSENVLVVWDDEALASRYLAHWNSRWSQGRPAALAE